MAQTPHARARTAPADRDAGPRELEHQIQVLARMLVSATSAGAALVSCRIGGVETIAREPRGNSRWHSLLARAIVALDAAALNQLVPQDSCEPTRVVLRPEQLAPIASTELDPGAQILAAAAFDHEASTRVAPIAPAARP